MGRAHGGSAVRSCTVVAACVCSRTELLRVRPRKQVACAKETCHSAYHFRESLGGVSTIGVTFVWRLWDGCGSDRGSDRGIVGERASATVPRARIAHRVVRMPLQEEAPESHGSVWGVLSGKLFWCFLDD